MRNGTNERKRESEWENEKKRQIKVIDSNGSIKKKERDRGNGRECKKGESK